MPIVKVEILKGNTQEEKQALVMSIYTALTEALNRPDLYRHVTITEYSAEDFLIPFNKTNKYTSIEIQMFAGKSLATKKRLYQTIVRNLEELGIDKNDVFIVLHEIPLTDFGMQGGNPASELYSAYKSGV